MRATGVVAEVVQEHYDLEKFVPLECNTLHPLFSVLLYACIGGNELGILYMVNVSSLF
jgi:hypothetical protein